MIPPVAFLLTFAAIFIGIYLSMRFIGDSPWLLVGMAVSIFGPQIAGAYWESEYWKNRNNRRGGEG